MDELKITGLHTYPIKGAAGISHEKARVMMYGLRFDRQWLLVGGDGKMITQRQEPRLALIQPTIESDHMRVEAEGMEPLEVPLAETPSIERDVPVRVHNRTAHGLYVETDGWFTRFLGKQARLLTANDAYLNAMPQPRPGVAPWVQFADAHQLLLTTEASLAELNHHTKIPANMNRFRPNIVVNGRKPYEEDHWDEIILDGLRAFVVGSCIRCVVPDVNQETGEKDKDRDVYHALRKTRYGQAVGSEVKGTQFGQNVDLAMRSYNQDISVGGLVTVVRKNSQSNVKILQKS